MAKDRIDPSDQIPEAALLEQQTPLAPQSLTDPEPAISDSPGGLADEADWLEQQTPVPGQDDDEYPREPSGAGWS